MSKHEINDPIMSYEPFPYEGEHDPNEKICTITWRLADLIDMMNSKNIDITDENIDTVLSNRFAKTLQERSIEEGWGIISDLVDFSL